MNAIDTALHDRAETSAARMSIYDEVSLILSHWQTEERPLRVQYRQHLANCRQYLNQALEADACDFEQGVRDGMWEAKRALKEALRVREEMRRG